MARQNAVPRWPHPFILIPIAVVQVVGTIGATHGQPEARPMDALAVALLLAGPLALALLRNRPVLSLWVVIAITLVFIGRGYAVGPIIISPTIALIRTVLTGHRRAAWFAGVVGVGGAMLAHVVSGHRQHVGWGSLLGVVGWVAIVLAAAEVIRNRAERRASLAAARAEQARRRASEERLRIAQELHDVLAHNISLINVQAGVGLHLMDNQPEQARRRWPPSSRRARRRSASCARCSTCCAATTRRRHAPRPAASTSSTPWSPGCRHPSWTWCSSAPDRSGPCPPASTWLRSASCRRRSPTSCAMPTVGPRAVVRLDYGDDSLVVQVDDDGGSRDGGRGPARRVERAGWRGQRPARHARAGAAPSAGRSTPGRGPAAASGCGPAADRAATVGGRRRRGTGVAVVIRVLLADDQALVRAGFRALLDAEPDIEVVGEAADGDEAVRLGARPRSPTSC